MYKKVSIIIPVYNERATIEQVLLEVKAASTFNLEKEIILIDDNSTDGTKDFLQKLQDPSLKIIYHETNQGKGAALHEGFVAATGDIIVVQDADLEYNPAEIEKILSQFTENQAQVVYGSRYLHTDKKLEFWHSFFNKFFTKVSNLFTGQKITDVMTCYKAFNRQVLDKIVPLLDSKRFGFEPEITSRLSKLGYKIIEVPISYQPRSKNEGKHMNFKGQLESLWALIKYSNPK